MSDCPNFVNHTYGPEGYLAWHEWAEAKAKTHRNTKCPGCGLYKIWTPKPPKTEKQKT